MSRFRLEPGTQEYGACVLTAQEQRSLDSVRRDWKWKDSYDVFPLRCKQVSGNSTSCTNVSNLCVLVHWPLIGGR